MGFIYIYVNYGYRKVCIMLNEVATCAELYEIVKTRTDYTAPFHLMYGSIAIPNNKYCTIEDNNIENNSTILLMPRVPGGDWFRESHTYAI